MVSGAEQKEKLSEVEQQLKRAEALQRRRMQVEKAARESEVCPCLLLNLLCLPALQIVTNEEKINLGLNFRLRQLEKY